MHKSVVRTIFGILLAVIASAAQSQDWPNRPVRIVVPFGAGGSGDMLARVIAQHLSTSLKQQFVVENRPGGAGILGTKEFLTAAPDGYTIGITNLSTLSLVPVINPTAPYHPINDFSHIAYVGGAPIVLAANPTTNVKTLKDFVGYVSSPGKIFQFASSGVGSDGHLMGQAIAISTNVKSEHVPYRSTSQALTDLVGGHVLFSTFTLSSTAQFIRTNSLTGVAVTSADRMLDYPDLPTFKELNHPELVGTTWFSLSGPAKLPPDVVNRLNREINAAVATADVQARFRRDGFIAQPMSATEFASFVALENAKWKPLIESAGLVGKGN